MSPGDGIPWCAGKLMVCHPERSVCFAKRSRCGVDGPLIAWIKMNAPRIPANPFKERPVIRKLSVVSLTIVAFVFGANVVCQARPQALLTKHVVDVTRNGEAASVGRLPANQSMRIDIV